LRHFDLSRVIDQRLSDIFDQLLHGIPPASVW
jgi:hypothetical protein